MSKCKVYVILDVVDLGDNIVSIHKSKTIAEQKCNELMAVHRKQYGVLASENQYYVDEYDLEA